MAKMLFTSESVTEGHPDKVSDQVSDAVLDAIFSQDPYARVACETFCTTGVVTVMGEITTTAQVDIPAIVREVVCDIGYNSEKACFNGNNCAVMVSLDKQSPDIAMGVDKSFELKDGEEDAYNLNGAGDQGMMFGYACDETPELMPLAISLAHKMSYKLTCVRKSGELAYLRPDGKTQVTIEYVNGAPVRIDSVVLSTQHSADIDLDTLRSDMLELVIMPILPQNLIDEDTKYYINPTGRFVVGGPQGDTGLTGRKIIVDTYGGYARHGGGAFSGKDCTKVDRSACYMARYIAKNIVASGLAKKCEIQLSYAIGVSHPLSLYVNLEGTGKDVDEAVLEKVLRDVMDLTPRGIRKHLRLNRPIYAVTSAYGHFGRTPDDKQDTFTWERIDLVDRLRTAFNR